MDKWAQAQPPPPGGQPGQPGQPPPPGGEQQPPPPKPWMRSKLTKKHMHKLSYAQGFMDKCSELGINPEHLL